MSILMKQLILKTFLFFLIPFVSFAQIRFDESAKLKKHLGLPDSTKIELGNPEVPFQKTYKIYFATGLDIKLAENFYDWAKRWNRMHAQTGMQLEITNKMAEARWVLARFLEHPAFEQDQPHIVVTDEESKAGIAIPVDLNMLPEYTYILEKSDGTWKVIFRNISKTNAQTQGNTGKSLWNEWERKLKEARMHHSAN